MRGLTNLLGYWLEDVVVSVFVFSFSVVDDVKLVLLELDVEAELDGVVLLGVGAVRVGLSAVAFPVASKLYSSPSSVLV